MFFWDLVLDLFTQVVAGVIVELFGVGERRVRERERREGGRTPRWNDLV